MTTPSAQGTNYRETHFQHADLTPIWGKPKNESLKVLFNEVKANLQTIHSNLGGGDHGHLRMGLHPILYDTIAPGTPYIRPVFPGAFKIPERTTNIQAQMLREAHQKSLQDVHEAEAIHNAILQQTVKAIKPMYLKAFRNPITQSFNFPIHNILQGLMSVYGKLNPKHFMAAKNALKTFQYHINLPVDIIFDPINDMLELAEVAG